MNLASTQKCGNPALCMITEVVRVNFVLPGQMSKNQGYIDYRSKTGEKVGEIVLPKSNVCKNW